MQLQRSGYPVIQHLTLCYDIDAGSEEFVQAYADHLQQSVEAALKGDQQEYEKLLGTEPVLSEMRIQGGRWSPGSAHRLDAPRLGHTSTAGPTFLEGRRWVKRERHRFASARAWARSARTGSGQRIPRWAGGRTPAGKFPPVDAPGGNATGSGPSSAAGSGSRVSGKARDKAESVPAPPVGCAGTG